MRKTLVNTLALACLLVPAVALGDVVPKQNFKEQIPVREQPAQAKAAVVSEPDCVWGARLSPGLANWFFNDEDSDFGPALYLDVFRSDLPLNFRVGVEGAHVWLEQDNARAWAEWEGLNSRITYVRVPFAVEYAGNIDDQSMYFLGGGPDILHSANDNTDTTVGAHIGARIGYNFSEHFGVALEAGYMWARFDSEPGNVNLDGAYLTPTVSYTF